MPSTVLVTGACGLIGRHVVAGLLSADCNSTDTTYYDAIIAVDMLPADAIASMFQFSHRVLPLELDLGQLIDSRSGSACGAVHGFKDTLRGVCSIIHCAGVVDTRESPYVARLLERVNVRAVDALLDLAGQCGVRRFVHVSSASAVIRASPFGGTRGEARPGSELGWGERAFLSALCVRRSMLSSMEMSTYGQTKLAAERVVLSRGQTTSLRVAVLRPHVVWGRGDTLSTEILLGWNAKPAGLCPRLCLPEVSIGDPSSPVVSGRVDVVATYILMADVLLGRDGGGETPDSHSHSPGRGRGLRQSGGSVFSIGDGASTLRGIHSRIAQCRPARDQCLQSLTGAGRGAGAHGGCELCSASGSGREESEGISGLQILIINTYIVIFIMAVIEWIQHLLPSKLLLPFSNYFRLLTPNNLAYSSRLTSYSGVGTHEGDCMSLFCRVRGLEHLSEGALQERFAQWKAERLCDHVILSKNWFEETIHKTLLPATQFENIPMPDTPLASPCALGGPVVLPNRVIKAATFECMAGRDGVPTDELSRYHARNVAGGAGMTIVAYASVSSDGRSFPTQICLAAGDEDVSRRTEAALTRLCAAVHTVRAGALAALQLTHAGAFADSGCNAGRPARGPSDILNPLTMTYSQTLAGDHIALQRILSDFTAAVDYSRKVGFDAIELHLGHGYLLSQFLSAATNPGADAHARLDFPLRVLRAVCARAHGGSSGDRYIAVLVKFNVSEMREEHLSLSDARLFARSFMDAGADLLVPSGGHVMTNGLHMLRGGRPLREMADAQQQRLKKWVIAWLGKYFVQKEPFREAFFRERVISVMLGAGVPLSMVCLVGGVHELRTADCAVRYDGFRCVQLARVLLADPDWCVKVGAAAALVNINIEANSKSKSDVSGDSSRPKGQQVSKASSKGQSVSALASNVCTSTSVVNEPMKLCDNSNRCIVGATMALEPLRCSKRGGVPDW
jgi:2,4-dienoyl-CoA reductase-like NADH-dependent reductase (Old Yellow Enzyme family)/nucleoside-diphosphate-sugar epimerase